MRCSVAEVATAMHGGADVAPQRCVPVAMRVALVAGLDDEGALVLVKSIAFAHCLNKATLVLFGHAGRVASPMVAAL